MKMVDLQAEGIALTLDCSVGHIADFAVEQAGRVLRPLHRAPWVDREPVPEGTPPNVERLSGDFFCAPFSRNDVAEAPTHGWPANSAWDLAEKSADEAGASMRLVLRRRVMGARVEKILRLRHDHPFLYQEHRLVGGEGALPVAHHTMIRMEAGGRIAFSPKKAALTPDTAQETDPARGRSLFAYPARSTDLTRFPAADGGMADLTRYPPGENHEDFITLVDEPGRSFGFTAIAREAERDLVLVLKDPRSLPVTMLWHSNGGRNYAPWNGRHAGVLGIEDGCSAVGHRQSLGDNAVRREGVPTAITLDPEGMIVIRQVIGCAAIGALPENIAPVGGREALKIGLPSGEDIELPFDTEFLDRPVGK